MHIFVAGVNKAYFQIQVLSCYVSPVHIFNKKWLLMTLQLDSADRIFGLKTKINYGIKIGFYSIGLLYYYDASMGPKAFPTNLFHVKQLVNQ